MHLLSLCDPLYAAVFSASFSTFIAGTSLTWSSPVVPKLTDPTESPFDGPATPSEAAWISSILTLGAALGSLLYAHLANQFGKRYTILSLGVPFLVSYALMALWESPEAFHAARLMAGIAVGGSFSLAPVYIAELASKSNRGALISTISCGVNMGFLFSYSLGPFVDVSVFNSVLSVFPAIFLILFFSFGFESPHYYIKNGQENLAKGILLKVRNEHSGVDEEIADTKRKLKEQSDKSVLEILRSKAGRKSFIIAIGLLICQQFSGINIVLFYSQTIFELAESNIDPKICPIIIGIVQVLVSFSTPFLIDRYGRKILFIGSSAGMILSQMPLGTYCYLKDQGINVDSLKFLPLLTLTLSIVSYNCGVGPIPWTVLGEIFPSRIRAFGTSVATFINWSLTFAITKTFEDLINAVGLGPTFWFYSCCCVLAILFVQFCVLETKGKTLEEIQDELNL